LGPRGETHWLAGEGVGGPIPTKGQTLWYSMYTIIPLRLAKKYSNNFYLVSLEIYGIPFMKKVRKFREIPRNFTELYDTEFRGILAEF
jgi:hypothetical protein